MNATYITLFAIAALMVIVLVALFKDREIEIDMGNEGVKNKRHMRIKIKKSRGQTGQVTK